MKTLCRKCRREFEVRPITFRAGTLALRNQLTCDNCARLEEEKKRRLEQLNLL
jgi:hypothetical protein